MDQLNGEGNSDNSVGNDGDVLNNQQASSTKEDVQSRVQTLQTCIKDLSESLSDKKMDCYFNPLLSQLDSLSNKVQSRLSEVSTFYNFLEEHQIAPGTPASNCGYFLLLPDELLIRVFLFLDPIDLVNLSPVSVQWRRLSADESLWRRLYFKKYKNPLPFTVTGCYNISQIQSCHKSLSIPQPTPLCSSSHLIVFPLSSPAPISLASFLKEKEKDKNELPEWSGDEQGKNGNWSSYLKECNFGRESGILGISDSETMKLRKRKKPPKLVVVIKEIKDGKDNKDKDKDTKDKIGVLRNEIDYPSSSSSNTTIPDTSPNNIITSPRRSNLLTTTTTVDVASTEAPNIVDGVDEDNNYYTTSSTQNDANDGVDDYDDDEIEEDDDNSDSNNNPDADNDTNTNNSNNNNHANNNNDTNTNDGSESKYRIDWRLTFQNRHRIDKNWALGKFSLKTFSSSSCITTTNHDNNTHINNPNNNNNNSNQRVRCLQFDEQKIITGSFDQKTIKIYDFSTRRLLSELCSHTGGVMSLKFSDQSPHLLLSASRDKTLKLWDLNTSSLLSTFSEHLSSVWCLDFLPPNLLCSGSEDRTVKFYDLRTNPKSSLLTLPGHIKGIGSIAFSPYSSSPLLVSGSRDKTIRLWDLRQTGHGARLVMKGHTNSVRSCKMGQNFIVSGSWDNTVKLWDMDGIMVRDWGNNNNHNWGHKDRVLSVEMREEGGGGGGRVVSGGFDEVVKVWDMASGRLVQTLVGHKSPLAVVKFDECRVVSGARDLTIKVWDFS